MTGKIKGLQPSDGLTRIYGVVHQFYSPKWQRWVTRSWPKGSGPDTPYRAIGRKTFAAVVRAIKQAPPEEMIAAEAATANTPYLMRDFLFKAATGTLIEFTDTNGRLWMSTRVAIQNIQPMLDSISAVPGAMLIRGAGYWTAIIPSDPNMMVRTNAVTKIPEFVLPQDVIFPLLNAMAADVGDMLLNGPAGWQFLPAGADAEVLTSNGPGFLPSWQVAGGGGGGYNPGTPPTVIQTAWDNSGGAATFAAAPLAGNLLVAMCFNPSNNAPATGWTVQTDDVSGTDYGLIVTKLCGAGESVTQNPITSAPGTGFLVIWEITGQSATPFIGGNSETEHTGAANAPVLLPNAKDCLGLWAMGATTGGAIIDIANGMNVDVRDSTSTRLAAAGHGDLADAPMCGALIAFSASVNSKGAACLITA